MGLAHWSLVSPSHSFSFLFLFRLIPWSAGALCVHFPAWASKTHSRRCLRLGTFSYSRGHLRPPWTEQVLCWGFIGFLRKPRNISLFSLLYFLNCKILSLSLSPFIYCLSFNCQCRPPEGIPGSNWGWTLANSYVLGTSLVVQGLKFRALNAGDRIWCLAGELDPTCPN